LTCLCYLFLLSFLFFQVFPPSVGCINLDSEEVSFVFSICALFIVYIYLLHLFFYFLCRIILLCKHPHSLKMNPDITPKLPKKFGILPSVRILDKRNVSADFPTMMCFTCFSVYFSHLFFYLCVICISYSIICVFLCCNSYF
jgi:hypothetical protein